MDSAHHADDEMRSMELVEKYRDRLVAQAKATMRARPGERIAGLILHGATIEMVISASFRSWSSSGRGFRPP